MNGNLFSGHLDDPIVMVELDTSNGVMFPLYDPDANLVYLCGKVSSNQNQCDQISGRKRHHFLQKIAKFVATILKLTFCLNLKINKKVATSGHTDHNLTCQIQIAVVHHYSADLNTRQMQNSGI